MARMKTGKGVPIRMTMENVKGDLCGRIASALKGAVSASLWYNYQENIFFVRVHCITGEDYVIQLGYNVQLAQLWYNKLPRRVPVEKLGEMGIINTVDWNSKMTNRSWASDLEDEYKKKNS